MQLAAMDMHIRGYSGKEIALQVSSDFNLVKVLPENTVRSWIFEAKKEARESKLEMTQDYLDLFQDRAEAMIRNLMPFALEPFKLLRKKKEDGEEIEYISEDTFEERVKAVAEIRKCGESVLRALGVYRPLPGSGEGEPATKADVQTFVLQMIQNNLGKSGEVIPETKKATVLELTSGDPVIDSL